MKTVIKYHIRTLTVNNEGEKQLFQIKLPKDAKKITGVLITVKPFERIKGRPKEPPFLTPIKKPFPILIPIKDEIPIADTKAVAKSETVAESKTIAVRKQPLIPIEHAI